MSEMRFVDNGDGTFTDNNTGLMWEKLSDDGSLHDKDTRYTWDNAFSVKIAALNAGSGFAGHRDWRLPTRNELASIVRVEWLDPVTACDYYWSVTADDRDMSRAWVLDCRDGDEVTFDKENFFHVRAVRAGRTLGKLNDHTLRKASGIFSTDDYARLSHEAPYGSAHEARAILHLMKRVDTLEARLPWHSYTNQKINVPSNEAASFTTYEPVAEVLTERGPLLHREAAAEFTADEHVAEVHAERHEHEDLRAEVERLKNELAAERQETAKYWKAFRFIADRKADEAVAGNNEILRLKHLLSVAFDERVQEADERAYKERARTDLAGERDLWKARAVAGGWKP